MTTPIPTVSVEAVSSYNAILMTWQHRVDKSDVVRAFHKINQTLNEAAAPVYVVVDITNNPRFPLRETINSALWGPYRNPKLKAWLIIGSNPTARAIERSLSGVTKRKNVFWFQSFEEVQRYLEAQPDGLADNTLTIHPM